jgi:hypothetical protein
MRRVLLATMTTAWLFALGAGACRPPSDAKPPKDDPMSPTPLAPEAVPQSLPALRNPLEPPDPSPSEDEEKPTLEQGLGVHLGHGVYLGHGGAFPNGVEYPPAPTTTTTVTTTVTTTATTTTGSGIEVGG